MAFDTFFITVGIFILDQEQEHLDIAVFGALVQVMGIRRIFSGILSKSNTTV